jgi:hypothetical protein
LTKKSSHKGLGHLIQSLMSFAVTGFFIVLFFPIIQSLYAQTFNANSIFDFLIKMILIGALVVLLPAVLIFVALLILGLLWVKFA